MSLATDILKRADNLSFTPRQSTKDTSFSDRTGKPRGGRPCKKSSPRKTPRQTVHHDVPQHEHVPGVGFDVHHGLWKAQFYDGTKNISIGYHPTQARAIIARKLYLFWRKQRMTDIPNKPERRHFKSNALLG